MEQQHAARHRRHVHRRTERQHHLLRLQPRLRQDSSGRTHGRQRHQLHKHRRVHSGCRPDGLERLPLPLHRPQDVGRMERLSHLVGRRQALSVRQREYQGWRRIRLPLVHHLRCRSRVLGQHRESARLQRCGRKRAPRDGRLLLRPPVRSLPADHGSHATGHHADHELLLWHVRIHRTDRSSRTAGYHAGLCLLQRNVLGMLEVDCTARTAGHHAGQQLLREHVQRMLKPGHGSRTARHHTGQLLLLRHVQRMQEPDHAARTAGHHTGRWLLRQHVQRLFQHQAERYADRCLLD